MTQLLLNSDGDLLFEENRFQLTQDNSDQEISQRIVQNLKFYLGE